jgi:hypothetical protein
MRRYFFVGLAILLSSVVTAVVVRGQATSAPVRTNVAGSIGRYELVINPNVRADTFLLDTETGKIWVNTEYTDLVGSPSAWTYQDRVDDDQQLLSWASAHQSRKTQP